MLHRVVQISLNNLELSGRYCRALQQDVEGILREGTTAAVTLSPADRAKVASCLSTWAPTAAAFAQSLQVATAARLRCPRCLDFLPDNGSSGRPCQCAHTGLHSEVALLDSRGARLVMG